MGDRPRQPTDRHSLTPYDPDRAQRDHLSVEMEFAFDLTIGEERTVSVAADEPTAES